MGLKVGKGLFIVLAISYVIFYIWALIYRIVPWLNIAITEFLKLTLIQVIVTILFFTIGLGLFIICVGFLIFILVAILD